MGFFQAFDPGEKDACLYLEARRIVIAEFQNIVYKEYLPMIIGPKMMQEKNLEIGNSPTKYDPERDPRVTNEFATVAFRFGHSQVQHEFRPWIKGQISGFPGHTAANLPNCQSAKSA